MTYGHLQADCLYIGISCGPNARCRVWEAFTFLPFTYLSSVLMIMALAILPVGGGVNFVAACVCQLMGLPVNKLICASNINNVLSELINTGHYNVASRGTQAVPTISPAIDIVRASNVERYFYLAMGRNGSAVRHAYRQLDDTGRFRLPPQVCVSIEVRHCVSKTVPIF